MLLYIYKGMFQDVFYGFVHLQRHVADVFYGFVHVQRLENNSIYAFVNVQSYVC